MASQLAEVSDRVGNFSEVAKGGKMSALAFKAGLIGLVATIGFKVGNAIGDIIFETEKFNRALENTKTKAVELDAAIAARQGQRFADNKEDIELIRDPAGKAAAYKQMLDTLNNDVATVTASVRAGERAVEDYTAMWLPMDNDVAMGEAAETQLTNDRERLKSLKAQRDEIIRVTSVRTAENAAIASSSRPFASQAAPLLDAMRIGSSSWA